MRRVDDISIEATGWASRVILGSSTSARRAVRDEPAIARAVDTPCVGVLGKGYRRPHRDQQRVQRQYDHVSILQPARVHELITRAKASGGAGGGARQHELRGGRCRPEVLAASDFVCCTVNGSPTRTASRDGPQTRQLPAFTRSPSSSTRTRFFTTTSDQSVEHFVAARVWHASWGFFDFRAKASASERGPERPGGLAVSSVRSAGSSILLREM